MRNLVASIEAEYARYKTLAEKAITQIDDAALFRQGPGDANSIPVIVRHISGNLRSRFTDFLTSDGEKPWRDRDTEFEEPSWSRAELLDTWEAGWRVLFDAIRPLTDDDLSREVHIRGQALKVHEALHRSLAHASYHAGQIVYLAKAARGDDWVSLSIPKGRSQDYNQQPSRERPADQAAELDRRLRDRS